VNLEHIAGLDVICGLEWFAVFGDTAVFQRFVRFAAPLRKTRYLHKFIQSHRDALAYHDTMKKTAIFGGSFLSPRREE
jgi:hypothetical protein